MTWSELADSVEPGIAWSFKGHTLGVSAPIAIYRNRQRSVPDDRAGPQRHVDAAFADSLIVSVRPRASSAAG